MGAPNSLVKSCTPQTQGKTALVLKSNIFKAWVVYLVPSCRLLLNSVHEDDSGTYTCKLSTAKGTQPVIFIFIFIFIVIIIIISGLVVINLLTSCVVVLLWWSSRGADLQRPAEGHSHAGPPVHAPAGRPGGDGGPQRPLPLQGEV